MCVALLLDGTSPTIDKLNWHFSEGYGIVDRIETMNGVVLVLKKA